MHEGDGFGDAARFVEIRFFRAVGGDVAKAAGTGADVAEDHDGGGAAGPAFAEVGTHGGLADAVEMMAVDVAAEVVISRTCGEFDAKPGRLAAGVVVGEDVEVDGA